MSDYISLYHLWSLPKDSEKESAQVLSTISKTVPTMSKQSCNITYAINIILFLLYSYARVHMYAFVTLDIKVHASAHTQNI